MPIPVSLETLARELKHRRDREDLSLRDVEEATGVSAATLSRIERGAVTPELEIIDKLASWLGLSVQAGGSPPAVVVPRSDDDLKRTIEVHLRANKKLSPSLARSIADTFDLVMKLELEKAKRK